MGLYVRACPRCDTIFAVVEKEPWPGNERRVECDCGWEPGTLWYEWPDRVGILVIWDERIS